MTFNGELRPYQQVASSLITARGKALLALDLGTGKTVVSIHAMEKLREEGKVKCALLIMSSSLTKQWVDRLEQFTDSKKILLVDGSLSSTKRTKLLNEALATPPEYLVMGIRQVVDNLKVIAKLNPELVLVDEVTCIKNFGTQQTKAIKKLKSIYRIGLTAEPIENGKAEELYSIMEWIDPTVFGSWQSFEANYINRNDYGIITGYRNMNELNIKLMTACISKRRDESDVAEFMPTVKEFNVYIEMDEETSVRYKTIVRELLRTLYDSGPSAAQELSRYYAGERSSGSGSDLGRVGSRLLAASLLLDSPVLLRASGEAYNDPTRGDGSQYAASLLDSLRGLPEGFYGAKMEACVEIATEYLEENPAHKVIIFCRFKGILPILQKELAKYQSVIFSGDLNGKQRGIAISRFTNEPDVRLFLSSDAGGYGVDLFAASHLINYDLPLSSGTFKQRNGRHVRASSTFRHVYIDNLIVKDSIEEYQLTRLDYKARVARAALTGRMSDPTGRVENDGKSLTKFLEEYLNG